MNYRDINDNEILNLVSASEEYLYILYDKYRPLIDKICLSYHDTNGFVDLDDLSQEAFIAFYYAVCNFDSNRDNLFFTYVVVCIKSRLNDYVRSARSNKNSINNSSISLYAKIDDEAVLCDVLSEGDETYKKVLLNDFYDSLILFKNDLSMMESYIFELKFNGFKVFEISSLLDVSRRTISNKLRSIRYKFEKIYNLDCVF